MIRDTQKRISLEGISVGTVQGSGSLAQALSSHTDHLTDASLLTNTSGNIAEFVDYLPYGQIRLDQQPPASPTRRNTPAVLSMTKPGYHARSPGTRADFLFSSG